MSGRRRLLLPAIGVVAALQFAFLAHAQEATDESVRMNVGFGRTSFLSVNATDAKAAFTAFAESVGERKGYDLDVTVRTFDSDEEFEAAIANQSLHLVIMVAWDYLDGGLDAYLEPCFLAIESGQGPREYMLLVANDSPYQHLRDLGGSDIILLENTNCEMSENWLTTMLLEERLGDINTLFASATTESKANKALLPVFFGQADACVVNRPVFDMMCELNPQVGQNLRAVATSEPLVDAVTFLAHEEQGEWVSPQHRADLIESIETLHLDIHGKQILTLFKADILAPFEDEFMAGTMALKEKHDRLLVEVSSR